MNKVIHTSTGEKQGSLGIVTSTSLKHLLIQYTGFMIGLVNAVLLFPSILTSEELGMVRILFSLAVILGQMAQFGAGNIIIKFRTYEDGNTVSNILPVGITYATVGTFTTSLVLLLFKSEVVDLYSSGSQLFQQYFNWLHLFVFSIAFFNLFDIYLSTVFKNSFSAILNFILLRLLHLGTILAYHWDWVDLDLFIPLYVGSQTVITLLNIGYTHYLGQLNIFAFKRFDLVRYFRAFSSFGLFSLGSKLAHIVVSRLDMLMIGNYLGLNPVAVYSIAFSLSTFLSAPTISISRATTVLATKALQNNDLKELSSLYKKGALNQLLLGSVVFILICVNYEILTDFLPKGYGESTWVFYLLGLAKLVDMAFGMNGAIIVNSKYYKWEAYFSTLLLVVTFLTNAYFIPKMGINGAAIATLLSALIYNTGKYIFVWLKFRLSPFSGSYIKLIVCSLLTYYIAAQFLNFSDSILHLLLKSALVVLLFTGMSYFLKTSKELNNLIDKTISLLR